MVASTNILDLLFTHQATSINISPLQILNFIGTTSNHYLHYFSTTLSRLFLVPRKIRFNLLGQNIQINIEFQKSVDNYLSRHHYINLSSSDKWSLLQCAVLYAGEKSAGIFELFRTPESEFTAEMFELVKIRDRIRKTLSTNNRLSPARIRQLKSRLFNNKIKKERFKINKDNFDSYLDKINKFPYHMFYELCK